MAPKKIPPPMRLKEPMTDLVYKHLMEKADAASIMSVLSDASSAYYNTETPLMTDAQYDNLYDKLSDLIPEDHPFFNRVGAIPNTGSMLKELPYYAGSLKKVKDPTAYKNWLAKMPTSSIPKGKPLLQLSAKLDGISCVIKYSSNETGFIAYKRGSGVTGTNITNAVNYVEGVPSYTEVAKLFKKYGNTIALRGELIVSKDRMATITNPRNYANGRMSAHNPVKEDITGIIDLCIYEVVLLDGRTHQLSPSEQHLIIKKLAPSFVPDIQYVINEFPTYDEMKAIFKNIAKTSKYLCDGVVMKYNLPYELPTDKNPSYAMAFKDMASVDQVTVQTEVLSLEWNISKTLAYKPIVHIKPVVIDGCNISATSGKNYRWLLENGVNVGAIVTIERSGAVIPNILDIVKKSTLPIEFPPNSAVDEAGIDLVYTGGSKSVELEIEMNRTVRLMSHLKLKTYFNARFVKAAMEKEIVKFEQFLTKANYDLLGMKPENSTIILNTFKNAAKDPLEVVKLLAVSGDAGKAVGSTKLLDLYTDNSAFFHDVKATITTIPSGVGQSLLTQVNVNHKKIVAFTKLFQTM